MPSLAALALFGFSTLASADYARFLYEDKDAIQTRADMILAAKKEILVEYFAVTDDDISTGGIALLCDAAKRGVDVKILLDALSSSVKVGTMAATTLHCKDKDGNSRIEFRRFNPFDISSIHDILSRDHSKLLAVDGKFMIVGGRNVDDKYFGLDPKRNFKDLDALVAGNVVADARRYFMEMWDKEDIVKPVKLDNFKIDKLLKDCEGHHPRDIGTCRFQQKEIYRTAKIKMDAANVRMNGLMEKMKAGKGAVTIRRNADLMANMKNVGRIKFLSNATLTNVGKKNKVIADELYSLFRNANQKVLILSPYLIPTARAKDLFEDLIQRGVDTTIITNSLKSTDNLLAQAGFRAAKNSMIEMGIELYEYNLIHTAHAKTAVIDDKIVLIGTYNLDPRSSQINREIGIVMTDEGSGIAKDLTDIINKFRDESLLIGKNGKKMNEHLQNKDVGRFKKGAVEVLKYGVPLFKSQL